MPVDGGVPIKTITLAPGFFDLDPEGQANLFVHEILHASLHLTDIDLAKELGLGTFSNRDDASKAISDWIGDGCKK